MMRVIELLAICASAAATLCAQVSLEDALVRATRGKCEEVLPILEQAQASREAGIALAQCHMAARRFSAAAPLIARLQITYPSDPDILYLAATYHQRAWNDVIRRMYETSPASWRVDQLSAEVFETQGKYAEAIAEYRKAIAKEPRALNLHFRLGRALLMQSHDPAALDGAREEFEAELKLNADDAVAEYQVGQILVSRGNKIGAYPHIERAAQLRPDFPEALIAVAKIRMESKQFEEAISYLERALKIQPRSETVHYNLMLAYRAAGRDSEAARESAEIKRLQKPPEGEFTEFLKRLGDSPRN